MAPTPPVEPIADVPMTPDEQRVVVKRWRRGTLSPDTMTPDERRVVQAQMIRDARDQQERRAALRRGSAA